MSPLPESWKKHCILKRTQIKTQPRSEGQLGRGQRKGVRGLSSPPQLQQEASVFDKILHLSKYSCLAEDVQGYF